MYILNLIVTHEKEVKLIQAYPASSGICMSIQSLYYIIKISNNTAYIFHVVVV